MQNQRPSMVKKILAEKNIDALLISNFYNILYLTGFKTLTTEEREAFVLVTKNNIYLFTDERYINKNYELRITNYELKLLEPTKGLTFYLQEIAKEENIHKLGFEAEDLKYIEYKNLKQKLTPVELISCERSIILIREIKDEDEVEKISQACEIGDQCLRDIVSIIKLNMSEKEIAFKIEMWLKEKEHDLAFDPIVGIDVNSSLPHYNTKEGKGKVKEGSVILIDFGVKYKDYLSDITRMFFFDKPKDETINIYNILLNTQEKTIEIIGKFEFLKDVDDFCRQLISDHQLPSYPHSTGHGVGLEIHEYPKVSFNSPDHKISGQVFTIEPGIYFAGKYGMRIEDTVVIDNNLKARILTKYPKSLQII